jgi:hypothetical protein
MKLPPSIVRELGRAQPVPPARDGDVFWEEFRNRARQDVVMENRLAAPAPSAGWFLRFATATILLVLGASLALLWQGGWRPFPATAAAIHPAVCPVRSIHVAASHDSYLILEDPADRGTIVWLCGLPAPDETEKEPTPSDRGNHG